MKKGAEFILGLMVLIAGSAVLVLSGGAAAGFIIISLGALFLVYPGTPDRRTDGGDFRMLSLRHWGHQPKRPLSAGHHHVRGVI